MGALQRLIDRIAAGEITAEDAVPELRAVLLASRPRPEPGSAEWLAAEWDVDDTDTWTEVEAARITGRLTDDQANVLRAGITQAAGSTPSYGDEEILQGLRRAAAAQGTPLIGVRYDEYAAGHSLASRVRIIQRWGSWNAACAAAGLEVKAAHSGFATKWTDQELLEHVADFFESGGSRSYTAYDAWARATEGAPSAQTVRNRFKRWSAVKAGAEAVLEDRAAKD